MPFDRWLCTLLCFGHRLQYLKANYKLLVIVAKMNLECQNWDSSHHPLLDFVRQRARTRWLMCTRWRPDSKCPPLDHRISFPERALVQHMAVSRRMCPVYCPRRTRYWSRSQLFWCWSQHLVASSLPAQIQKTQDNYLYLQCNWWGYNFFFVSDFLICGVTLVTCVYSKIVMAHTKWQLG